MYIMISILILIFAIYLGVSIKGHYEYVKLRFKLFKLRDEVLWLAESDNIPKDEAVRLYNTVNWAVRYVREFPVFFLFGLIMVFEHLNLPETQEELKGRLDAMEPALKDWYFRWNDLTLEGIETFTPMAKLIKASHFLGFHILTAAMPFAIWLTVKMALMKRHPLAKSIFGQFDLAEAKKRSDLITNTTKKACQINNLRMSAV